MAQNKYPCSKGEKQNIKETSNQSKTQEHQEKCHIPKLCIKPTSGSFDDTIWPPTSFGSPVSPIMWPEARISPRPAPLHDCNFPQDVSHGPIISDTQGPHRNLHFIFTALHMALQLWDTLS